MNAEKWIVLFAAAEITPQVYAIETNFDLAKAQADTCVLFAADPHTEAFVVPAYYYTSKS